MLTLNRVQNIYISLWVRSPTFACGNLSKPLTRLNKIVTLPQRLQKTLSLTSPWTKVKDGSFTIWQISIKAHCKSKNLNRKTTNIMAKCGSPRRAVLLGSYSKASTLIGPTNTTSSDEMEPIQVFIWKPIHLTPGFFTARLIRISFRRSTSGIATRSKFRILVLKPVSKLKSG